MDDSLSDEISSHFITWNRFKSIYNLCQLSFVTINARSLNSKFNEIVCKISLLKEKISFIIVTETHLHENSDVNLDIPTYKCENYYRMDGHNGGGIKLYYLDHISIARISGFESDSCESVMVRADVPGYGPISVCGIYRPPQKPIGDFCVYLESLFEHSENRGLVLLGDFNINTLDVRNSNSTHYLNLLESYGYKNEITLPTYLNPCTNIDSSCLDHVVHNLLLGADSYVLKPNLSDHYAVALVFHQKIDNKPVEITFRDFSNDNREYFLENLNSEFSLFNLPPCNIDEQTSYIITFLTKMLNKYFHIKKKCISQKRLNTPWLTGKIKKCINKKHRWFRMSRNGFITHESYKRYCIELKKLLYIAESEYYSKKLHSLRNNSRKNWTTLNKLLGKMKKLISPKFDINGGVCTDPKIIANEFNNFFISHPLNIQRNIPISSVDFSNMVPFRNNSCHFDDCSDQEVSLEIDRLKKSGGIHDLSSKFLKLCKPHISTILANLFNRCITEGIFPSALKLARVTPVYKKGVASIIANYRPISVISNLSKIFESIIYKRISAYFESNGLLNADQFGFRKQRNTEMAIFSLLERVIPAFEQRAYALAVFLDFSACFDTVDRNMFMDKLDRYGVRGKPHDLISSYFTGREQQVVYRGKKSVIKQQNLGVVQGSKCGPLYYDIYSGDLAKICFEDEFLMFADDTCLTYFGENIDELIGHVNERLSLIYEWCCFNKLSLNASKCKFMVFSNKPYNVQNCSVLLGSHSIERVSNFKYLGVTIDEKLKYNDHIKVLCSKMSRMRGVAYRLKNHLDIGSAKHMYYACVYSVLTYCICVWGGLLSCTRKADRLSTIHAKTVINLFSKFFPNNDSIFKNMKILKLRDIHRLYAGIYMYKVIKLNQCPTIQVNLNLNYPDHNYGTRLRNNPRLPFPRVDAVKINYVYQCTDIWNSLPDTIKSKETLKTFKRELTNHFIESY